MIKTWAVIFFYFSTQTGMQSTEVRGISTEIACKALVASYNAKHYGTDIAYCYPIVETSQQMQIVFPEPTKVEK